MKQTLLGTPIYWVSDKTASVEIDFDIQPIRIDVKDRLLEHMCNSALITNKSTELIVNDDVINGIRYKLKLNKIEIDYLEYYIDRLEDNIELLLEQFMYNSGGYHQIQA